MRNDFLNEWERRSFLALASFVVFALFACLARVLQDTRDAFSGALAAWGFLSVLLSLAVPPLVYAIWVASDSE